MGRDSVCGSTRESGRVFEENGTNLLGPGKNEPVEHLHGIQGEEMEGASYLFPELFFGANFLPDLAEQRTRELLHLINEKASIMRETKFMLRCFFPRP